MKGKPQAPWKVKIFVGVKVKMQRCGECERVSVNILLLRDSKMDAEDEESS